MKAREAWLGILAIVVGACASTSAPEAPVAPPIPGPPARGPACGEAPPAPVTKKPPSCENYTLKGGQSFHDQLAVQLASGSFAQMDCPRMRYHDQDTPICVTKDIGGRTFGACCPPGHTDPRDPECTSESYLHQMMGGGQIWEWCQKGQLPSRPCEPCVWESRAQR